MTDIIENISYTIISIPDLNENPYNINSIVLNNRTYYFEYFWNIRQQKAYISIYILVNNERVYLLRNKTLTILINLSKYISDENNYWSGNLYFTSVDISNTYDYTQQNISADYQLIYWN